MIDTIKFKLIEGCSWVPPVHGFSEWDFREADTTQNKKDKEGSQRCSNDSTRFYTHRASGLRVWGSYFVPEWVEVSLPKLVYGRNGVLLKNDQDIFTALSLCEMRIREVVTVPSSVTVFDHEAYDSGLFDMAACTSEMPVFPLGLFDVNQRVDLCWQFKGDIETWIQAFRLAKVSFVRKPATEYKGSGLVWQGHDFVLRIYDKRREQYHKTGDVIRVEVQLRGRVLDEWGLRDPRGLVNGFDRLACLFRNIAFELNPVDRYDVGSLAGLIALLEAQGVTVGSQSVFEIWAAGKHRSTKSRMSNQVKAALPQRSGIDLIEMCRELVPVDLPSEEKRTRTGKTQRLLNCDNKNRKAVAV